MVNTHQQQDAVRIPTARDHPHTQGPGANHKQSVKGRETDSLLLADVIGEKEMERALAGVAQGIGCWPVD